MTPDQARAWLILEGWGFRKADSWVGVLRDDILVWRFVAIAGLRVDRHYRFRSNTDVLPPTFYIEAMDYILEHKL